MYKRQPDDCFRFHDAIEAAVVPAATRVYERRRAQLGLDRLQPWDLAVDPFDAPPLAPYHGQDELIQGSLNIFERVDPGLARQFATMAEENLPVSYTHLDVYKRQGWYSARYPAAGCQPALQARLRIG